MQCIICHFEVELDDVVVHRTSGRCICLRCYERETGNTKPMPKDLRRQGESALNDTNIDQV